MAAKKLKATLEPTEEIYEAPINGAMVPVRIWKGTTAGGIEVEAYVLAITPDRRDDHAKLEAELPGFMRPTRETYR